MCDLIDLQKKNVCNFLLMQNVAKHTRQKSLDIVVLPVCLFVEVLYRA